MPRILTIAATFLLIVHGLIHLMGTAMYTGHVEIKNLSYKTTLLGGNWDLGETGMRTFGAFWAVPAIGFVAAAIGFAAGWDWWKPALVGVTLFSLALTAMDWSIAFMGAIVDVAILALIALAPHLMSRAS
jgi:hypothetical protein